MALPAIGDGEQIGDGNTNETLNVGRSGQSVQVGGTAATLVAFHGTSPAAQASGITTLSINALSVSGVIGFTSSASFSVAITAINSILTVLRNKGLIAT